MTSTKQEKRRSILRCTQCGSQNLCYLDDETYCKECGLVLQGVPSVEHYEYGYIIGGKRLMHIPKK